MNNIDDIVENALRIWFFNYEKMGEEVKKTYRVPMASVVDYVKYGVSSSAKPVSLGCTTNEEIEELTIEVDKVRAAELIKRFEEVFLNRMLRETEGNKRSYEEVKAELISSMAGRRHQIEASIEWPVGEGEVVIYDPRRDPIPRREPYKIIDASLWFMDKAEIGERLYTKEQVEEIIRAALAATATEGVR